MTNQLTARDVEQLKSEGRYQHAGALSFILGLGGVYGCHYGMRSTRVQAMQEFVHGFMYAETDYE
jgi:hypothetical protein